MSRKIEECANKMFEKIFLFLFRFLFLMLLLLLLLVVLSTCFFQAS